MCATTTATNCFMATVRPSRLVLGTPSCPGSGKSMQAYIPGFDTPATAACSIRQNGAHRHGVTIPCLVRDLSLLRALELRTGGHFLGAGHDAAAAAGGLRTYRRTGPGV